MSGYPFADVELARRLEGAEAKGSRAFVDAHARIDPASGASHLERGGASAMFDGVGSPLTQTFCLGLFGETSEEDLDAIEHFFSDRGAAAVHEVSPLAGVRTFDLLTRRGYRPMELTSVLYQPIAPTAGSDGRMRVRIAGSGEAELWSRTAAAGWGNSEELQAFMRDVGRISLVADGTSIFFAEIDGQPVATASLSIHDGVAHLAGASTIPSARNQGAQRALLQARLRHAVERGCDLAAMGAEPGSASQRNAERQGFRVAYTRVKWGRPATEG